MFETLDQLIETWTAFGYTEEEILMMVKSHMTKDESEYLKTCSTEDLMNIRNIMIQKNVTWDIAMLLYRT